MAEPFQFRAAKAHNIARRKLVHGIGINDAWYCISYKNSEGVQTKCPYYTKWRSMLRRCYDPTFLSRTPTYAGCSITKEWHLFSTFRKWMEKQDWVGKELDKDILVKGNKIYSPTTCVFISGEINKLLLDSESIRGAYPQGVNFYARVGKYRAYCKVEGTSVHLGYFFNIYQAEEAYCIFKANHITSVANRPEASSQPQLQEALLREAKAFSDRAELLSHKIED